MHPDNAEIDIPVILTGPAASRRYFELLSEFVAATMGPEAEKRYQIIIDDADAVAHAMSTRLASVRESRRALADTFFFNWRLSIDRAFQVPFEATHESMAALNLSADQSPLDLAVNLRRAFSGIVAGNVKADGVRLVAKHGPFELSGDPAIVDALSRLLNGFIEDRRMKLTDPANYEPCFRLVG